MDGAFRKESEYALLSTDNTFHCEVIRQHCEYRIAPARIGELDCRMGCPFEESFSLAACSVVNGKLMPGLDKVCGHACTHLAQSDESDFHGHSPVENTCPSGLQV